MTRVHRFNSPALLASMLGTAGLMASPSAADAAEAPYCWSSCIDAVWEIRCPVGFEVQCDYWNRDCPGGVAAYCAFAT